MDMQLLQGSLINAISCRSGNESLALKIAFGKFFSLGLFSIVFYASNSLRCEIFMLASNFVRSFRSEMGPLAVIVRAVS